MKKRKLYMVMAIFLVITISCSSNKEDLENTTNLIGSKWVNLDTTTGIDFYTFISYHLQNISIQKI
ncbi:hypothetical protein [uncultured Polaribacter sp.]|uniref:hypothetical protein n=1 Tax=uncultured Polaribacter sp. TaxID=174711 RepID=UPI0026332E03|nr:hypothetical protein [uncultured Polaribacter sp.]